tara:strand:+ start:24593 stop:26014 length:1422 start_codon:yes stop_codon:yes gene_type:complete
MKTNGEYNLLDLQKLTLRRLLESSDSNLYSKISPKFFTGNNLLLYGKVEHFYRNNLRLPNIEELRVLGKSVSLQDYYETQILSEDNTNENIQNEFLVSQLQDFCIREDTIEFVDKLLSDLEELEQVEITDRFQNHLLDLNKLVPIGDELINVGTVETIPDKEAFVMYPSGLSHEYDSVNGGFALQELVLVGGRRGSGKSILVLNSAINRFLQGHTVGFFSIEMRYLEVYYRTLSILTEIPFLSYMRNSLTKEEIFETAKTKMKLFYEDGIESKIQPYLDKLKEDSNIKEFDAAVKVAELPLRENRLFIIDDESLTPNRIDHYCNMFSNKYKNFSMAVVDYLNIINVEESKDWKSQIILAEALKKGSRKYNITTISPYQIDSTLEARYAKGILDSADRAFAFEPSDPDGKEPDLIKVFTAKIRNGKNMTFNIGMNWECVKVDPTRNTSAMSAQQKLLPGAQFGTGKGEENSKDV